MKINRKLKRVIILTVISGILFTSCEKKELSDVGVKQESGSESEQVSGMLCFKDHDDYSATISQILNMGQNERVAWEEAQGFKSFGTAAEENYSSIDFSSFSSAEQIKGYVEENDRYLILLEDAEGEVTLETKMFNNPDRYVYNEGGMVRIGDKVYKCFDNYKGSVDAKNIELLRETSDEDITAGKHAPEISLKAASSTMHTALEGGGGGGYTAILPGPVELLDSYDDMDEENKNRTYLEITNWYDLDYVGLVGGGTAPRMQFRSYIYVQPYKKVLGIWCKVKRTISCDFKVIYERYNNATGSYVEFDYSYSTSGTYGEFIFKEFVPYNIHFGYTKKPVKFKAIKCWADTPSTNKASIYKNTSLF